MNRKNNQTVLLLYFFDGVVFANIVSFSKIF